MKRHAFTGFGFLLLLSPLAAGTTESAIVAAMKLPDAPNYSWVTTVDDDARSYTIEGKTDKASAGDLSVVEMPAIAAIRRGMNRGRGPTTNSSETPMTAVFSGDENLVIQTNDGWKKPDDLAANASRGDYGGRRGGYGGGGFGGGGFGGMGRRGMRGGGMRGSGGGGDSSDRPAVPYSNLQLTLSRPHEEIATIVASATDMKADGDILSGTLSETGAKLLLVHAGQKDITPIKASGTFRLWIKDGVLVKYEVKLEGTLAVQVRGDRKEIEVHQTATTELKDVGVTTLEVPDDAKKKLGIALATPPAPKPASTPAPPQAQPPKVTG